MVRSFFVYLTAAMALWHATVGCCAHHDHAVVHDLGVPHGHGVAGCCGGHAKVAEASAISDGVERTAFACECRRDSGDSPCEEHDCRFPAPERSSGVALTPGRDGDLVPPAALVQPTVPSAPSIGDFVVGTGRFEPPPGGDYALACRLHAAYCVWLL